ncbi:unnamed protein product [Caenorhabditis brenneri]
MAANRPLLDATVIPETCVYDSDAGCPYDGNHTKLATAGGKTLVLYDIRSDGKIYEYDRIPFPDRIIRVKYMRVADQCETLLVLTADGKFYRLDNASDKPNVSELCKITNPAFAKKQFVTFLSVSGTFAYMDDADSLVLKDLSTNTINVYPLMNADVCSILLIDPKYISILCDPSPRSTIVKIFYFHDNQMQEDATHILAGKHSRLLSLGDPFNALFSMGESSTEYIQIAAPGQKFTVTVPPCTINGYYITRNNEMMFSTINDGLFLIRVKLNLDKTPMLDIRRSSPELQFNTVSATAGYYYFFGSSQVDSFIAKVLLEDSNKFQFQVLQTVLHLGPIIAVECVQVAKQTKLIVASGDLDNSTLSIISNELEFCVEGRMNTPNVESIFPLKINSPITNAFIASTGRDSGLFVKNNTGVFTFHCKLHGRDTLAAASLYSSADIAQIAEDSISLISLKDLQNLITDKSVFKEPIKSAAIHGASAQILIAMERKVQLIFVNYDNQKASLEDVSTCQLDTPVTCMLFENSDFPRRVVIGMEKCCYLEVKVSETLTTIHKIKLPGTSTNANGLLHTQDQLIVNLKPGLVYVYQNFDLIQQKADTPKKVDGIYGIDNLVSLDTCEFSGFCSGTDCSIIRRCGGRLEFSKLTTEITTLCDISDSYNRKYFLASNGKEIQLGYFRKSTRSIKTNESVLAIATQNSTKSFAVATVKRESKDGISSTVPQKLEIARLCNRNISLDEAWRKNPDRTVTRIIFFPTKGDLSPICCIQPGPHESITGLLSCFSHGQEFYVIASALEYPSQTPQPVGKLISGRVDKDKRTFICYLNYDLPHNQIGRPEISMYLDTLMMRQGTDFYEWTWDPTLTTTANKITRICAAIQAVLDLGTGIFTAQSSSSTEVLRPGWNRRNGQEGLQEARMVMWAALSESNILGGVTDKRIRCYDIDHKSLSMPLSQRRMAPVTVGAILNLASTLTSMHSTSQKTTLYMNDASAVYSTKSGSVGFILRMSQQFGDMINQILSVAASSESFKTSYPFYSVFNNVRKNSGEHGFIDGEAL